MARNVFLELDKLREVSIILEGITRLEIRRDNPDIEIKGSTIFAPPDMEVLLTYLLMVEDGT